MIVVTDADLRSQLKEDEGYKTRVYKDTKGIDTVGVGRNLEAIPFADDEIELMLTNDITRAVTICNNLFRDFNLVPQDKARALINMAFNLGNKLADFHELIIAVNRADWLGAAAAAKNSAWYSQVGDRAIRICKVLAP